MLSRDVGTGLPRDWERVAKPSTSGRGLRDKGETDFLMRWNENPCEWTAWDLQVDILRSIQREYLPSETRYGRVSGLIERALDGRSQYEKP